MNTRSRILSRIKSNAPVNDAVDEYQVYPSKFDDPVGIFQSTLATIGGTSFVIEDVLAVKAYLEVTFAPSKKILSAHEEIHLNNSSASDNNFADLHVAVLQGDFAVAENGAIWITERHMPDRSIPFICEHLILVVHRRNVINNMHEAYRLIENKKYNFGTFIAGPSKTADIEQSLVLGAHGPKSLTVFILER